MTPDQAIDLPEEAGAEFPYSQGVRAGELLFVAGQLAGDDPGWQGPDGDIEAETACAMARIGRVLAAAGATHDDIVRVGIYLTDLSLFDRMNAVYRQSFSGRLPARTTVGVAALLGGGLIEIDCVALCRQTARPEPRIEPSPRPGAARADQAGGSTMK